MTWWITAQNHDLGPGNIKDHARPADPEKLQNKYSEMSGHWLLPEQKTICLTFDEGYENGFTAQILDTLAEKNVKAIFFCTYDYVRDNPDLVHRMINEGHILANHSYSHYNMTEVDLETAEEEITLMHDYVEENFNYSMGYFRFPEVCSASRRWLLPHSWVTEAFSGALLMRTGTQTTRLMKQKHLKK